MSLCYVLNLCQMLTNMVPKNATKMTSIIAKNILQSDIRSVRLFGAKFLEQYSVDIKRSLNVVSFCQKLKTF